ncbi:hypothetical protein RhiirA4_415085 [Rhizophagus irregularis]|uniref:Uncharacterized protein n=1 Tax=Rhizophagus irregularis TaxID=588596 RepID=A0A2I1FYQ5_9GLOM|nr:hypothetical protein RhiirA4_415085 [Rhizophagus irregularis]
MDKIQHYLMKPLISHINEVNENSEEKILSAENDKLANDDDNIYSDPSDLSEFRVGDSFNDWNIVQDRVNMYAKYHIVLLYRVTICHLSDESDGSDLTDRMTDLSADETDNLNHPNLG